MTKASRLLIPAVLTAAALLSAEAAVAAEPVSSPSVYNLHYDARLASDGKDLWLAALGKSASGEMRTQVLSYDGGEWSSLPGRPKTAGNYPLLIVARDKPGSKGSQPCIGDTPGSGPRVRCFQGGEWRELGISKKLMRLNLVGLSATGHKLTALFNEWKMSPISSEVRVAKLKGDEFVPFGPPVGMQGQILASLGETTTGAQTGKVDVALQLASSREAGKRVAGTVTKSGWTYSNLPFGLVAGSQLSGTVRTGDGLFFPANQAEYPSGRAGRPSSVSIFGQHGSDWTEIGGKAVSRGKGNSQGAIDPVGDEVWATWQEYVTKGRSPIRAKIHAARISPDGKRFTDRVNLWSGGPIGPGFTQAVAYKGDPVFLYMRNLGKDGPTRASVDFSMAD